MLISMPTGTSTIFGVFQAIFRFPFERNGRLPHRHQNMTAPKIAQEGIRPSKRIQRIAMQCQAISASNAWRYLVSITEMRTHLLKIRSGGQTRPIRRLEHDPESGYRFSEKIMLKKRR